MRATLAIPVVRALRGTLPCCLRAALPQAHCMGAAALPIGTAEVPSGARVCPTRSHEAFEMGIPRTIPVGIALIPSGTGLHLAGFLRIAVGVGGRPRAC